jgi:hypothetical protein
VLVRPVLHAALLVAAAAPGAVPSSAVLVENGYVSAALARRVDRLLAPVPRPTDEAARRRYLSRLGHLWPLAAALRLWEADEDPEPWIGTITALAATAADAGDELFDARSPLDGDELQRLFGLAPGPELGRLIEGLRNARIEGRIETRTQAIDWARRWIATSERRRPAD